MASKLTGARELRAKLRAAPARTRRAIAGAIEKTVDEVHADGLRNIDAMVERRSGLLRRFYRKRFSGKSLKGRVGYLTRPTWRRVYYAFFVHWGTQTTVARPFHDLAVRLHLPAHRKRMAAALRGLLRRV